MKDFEELSPVQKDALVEAFGAPDEYERPNLSQVENPVEAAEYELFRESMEGQDVSRGNMEDDKIESYKNIGFLREGEEGLEINSLWDKWQVEALQENNMYDFGETGLYTSEQSEKPRVSFTDIGNDIQLEIGDSLRYEVDEVTSDTAADKIQELSENFVKFFTGEEPGELGYENDNSNSKPTRDFEDGGENMENYEELEDELDELKDITQDFYELAEQASENAGVAEDVVDQVNAVGAMVADVRTTYLEAKNEYEDAADQIDEMDKIIEGTYQTLDIATEKLGDIYEEIESNIQETGDKLEDAYSSLQTLAESETPDFTPDPRVREVAEKVEGTDVDRFDELTEQFKDIGSSE